MSAKKYLIGLSLLFCLQLSLSSCGVIVRGVDGALTGFSSSQLFRQGRHSTLDETEEVWLKTAWAYFKNNSNLKTGLSNSIDKHGTTTMAHIADYLAAIMIAYEMQVIEIKEFDERLSALLGFLNNMELFQGKVPNKIYNTKNGRMVNFEGKEEQLGWSSIDMGRLLVWLNIVRQRYPEYHEYIDKAVIRWDFCEIVDQDGTLYGGVIVDGQLVTYQEGRLGYEEYAALGFASWGFDVKLSKQLDPYQPIVINGVDLYHDGRDPRISGVLAPVLTTPFAYMGLELNWDNVSDEGSSWDSVHTNYAIADAAKGVYRAQEARYEQEKIMTARAEHVLKSKPHFLFDSIFASGFAWSTISDEGINYPELALVSTKAAFAMWALWKTPYTDKLITVVDQLYNPKRGWYEGRYEESGAYEKAISSATNAMVLEALYYKKNGKIYQPFQGKSYSDVKLEDFFKHPGKCFPENYQQFVPEVAIQ